MKLVGGGRQSGQVEIDPPQEDRPARFGARRQAAGFVLDGDERIDRVANPFPSSDRGHSRPTDPFERVPRIPAPARSSAATIARPRASSAATGVSSASPGKWPVTSSRRFATPSPSLSSVATAWTARDARGLARLLELRAHALEPLAERVVRPVLRGVGTLLGHQVAGPAVVELSRQGGAQVIGQRLLVRRPSLRRQTRHDEPGRQDRYDSHPATSISHNCARRSKTGRAATLGGPSHPRQFSRRLIGSLTFFQRKIDGRRRELRATGVLSGTVVALAIMTLVDFSADFGRHRV